MSCSKCGAPTPRSPLCRSCERAQRAQEDFERNHSSRQETTVECQSETCDRRIGHEDRRYDPHEPGRVLCRSCFLEARGFELVTDGGTAIRSRPQQADEQTDRRSIEAGDRCEEDGCSGVLIHDRTEIVCPECDVVHDETPIDHGPEWRSFDDDVEQVKRAAAIDPTRSDDGLYTSVGSRSEGTTLRIRRLQRTHRRFRQRTVGERQGKTIRKIRGVGHDLDIPQSTIDDACMLFKEGHNAGLAFGRSLEQLATATTYLAARVDEVPVLLEQIADRFGADTSASWTTTGAVQRHCDVPAPARRPQSWVPRIADELEFEPIVATGAIRLAAAAEDAGIGVGGESPRGVAAAACYIAAVDMTCPRRTQDQVAEAAEISPPTIRKHRDSMRDVGLGLTKGGEVDVE